MRYEIILAPDAIQDYKGMTAYARGRIREGIEKYLRNEPEKKSKSRIKKLRGLRRPQYRLRIDDLRIFYDVIDQRVEILAIVSKSQSSEWLTLKGEKR